MNLHRISKIYSHKTGTYTPKYLVFYMQTRPFLDDNPETSCDFVRMRDFINNTRVQPNSYYLFVFIKLCIFHIMSLYRNIYPLGRYSLSFAFLHIGYVRKCDIAINIYFIHHICIIVRMQNHQPHAYFTPLRVRIYSNSILIKNRCIFP